AHRPGPSEVHLRQDGRAEPARAGRDGVPPALPPEDEGGRPAWAGRLLRQSEDLALAPSPDPEITDNVIAAVAPSRGGAVVSTILVVEDDPMERSMLRLIFESAGHDVLEAPHGQAALDAMRPDPLP